MNKKAEHFTPACKECGGSCCDYIAIEIDKPNTKTSCDHIRWYLLHININIFIDHDKKWFVEFRTPCEKQTMDKRCSIYTTRPKICREHGNENETCEHYDSPYYKYFTDVSQFEKYLQQKGFDWQFKNTDD